MYTTTLYGNTVTVYDYIDCRDVLAPLLKDSTVRRVSRHNRAYIDVIATMDIETTVVRNEGPETRASGKYSHFAYPYHWQACIGGVLVTGRYIDEWFDLASWISETAPARILVYIHNLAYEYNCLADYFVAACDDPSKDIFMRDAIHPLKIDNGNVEYRCSYQLTHKSLATLSTECGLSKSTDLDYETPRHSETPLTPAEIEYNLRDVYNLYTWLTREINRYSASIGRHDPHPCYMPLTQTGYVRHDIRHYWSNTPKGRYTLRDLRMTDSQYDRCRRAFRGGDTHANHVHLCSTYNDVHHRDFTSAYPSVMCLEGFPISPWIERGDVDINTLDRYISRGLHVIATYDLRDVSLLPLRSCYITHSKCDYVSRDAIIENGRVMKASQVILTCTEIDIGIIYATYQCTTARICSCMTARSGPIPLPIIKVILKYFGGKTRFKDVDGMHDEYDLSKQKLNGIYGCAATSLDHDDISINPDTLLADIIPQPMGDAKVLPYQWAPYITAYVRRNLSEFKNKMLDSFIYCDTDSIYYKSTPGIEAYIGDYNRRIVDRLTKLSHVKGLTRDDVMPMNPQGQRQYLGIFTSEPICRRFITVGAKRYVADEGTVPVMTFSGVPQTKPVKTAEGIKPGYVVDYIATTYGDGDIFRAFERFPQHAFDIPTGLGYNKLSNYVERGDFTGSIDDGNSIQNVSAKASMVLVPTPTTLTLDRSLYDLFFAAAIISRSW